MPRAIALAMMLCLLGAIASAQSAMKPTAPQKMMSSEEAKKMQTCEKQTADQNVKMDERAKFVMDCMTAKK
jgi:ABC-type transporter MlaC component